MNRPLTPQAAERLLGGYAAGILTDEERSALFQAALEHQTVFDALMDEEALRDLLSDPAARAHLLSVLSESAPAKVTPFWRRTPALLGLAATLLLAVTASLVTLRNPAVELRKLPAELPAPTQAPATEGTPPAQPPPAILQKARESGPRAAPAQTPAPSAPVRAPAPPAALLEVIAPPPAAGPAKEATAPTPDAALKADREERAPAAKGSVGGAAALNATPRREVEAKKKASLPEWRIEGRRLIVTHPVGHWVGLLRRAASGAVLLPAQPLAPGLTRFDLGSEPGPWDLYVLPAIPEAPLQLSADGPVAGFRTRIPDPEQGR